VNDCPVIDGAIEGVLGVWPFDTEVGACWAEVGIAACAGMDGGGVFVEGPEAFLADVALVLTWFGFDFDPNGAQ
jgi:hypothetical protein